MVQNYRKYVQGGLINFIITLSYGELLAALYDKINSEKNKMKFKKRERQECNS